MLYQETRTWIGPYKQQRLKGYILISLLLGLLTLMIVIKGVHKSIQNHQLSIDQTQKYCNDRL